jgi:predicted peptidase
MRLIVGCFLIFGLISCSTVRKGVLDSRLYTSAEGHKLPYNIFYPNSNSKEKLPLVLWLHGAGERGDDNVSPLIHIVPYLASSITQKRFPSVILAPQCAADDYWAPIKRDEWRVMSGGKTTPSMSACMELLDKILQDKRIDATRVYIGGLSMGGFGTLDLLARRPNLFAAAVPICGGADLEKATNYSSVPIWVFHGAKDPVVPADLSRSLVKTLEQAGGKPRYTEYPEGGHDVWNMAIREPELLPWLFSQQRK